MLKALLGMCLILLNVNISTAPTSSITSTLLTIHPTSTPPYDRETVPNTKSRLSKSYFIQRIRESRPSPIVHLKPYIKQPTFERPKDSVDAKNNAFGVYLGIRNTRERSPTLRRMPHFAPSLPKHTENNARLHFRQKISTSIPYAIDRRRTNRARSFDTKLNQLLSKSTANDYGFPGLGANHKTFNTFRRKKMSPHLSQPAIKHLRPMNSRSSSAIQSLLSVSNQIDIANRYKSKFRSYNTPPAIDAIPRQYMGTSKIKKMLQNYGNAKRYYPLNNRLHTKKPNSLITSKTMYNPSSNVKPYSPTIIHSNNQAIPDIFNYLFGSSANPVGVTQPPTKEVVFSTPNPFHSPYRHFEIATDFPMRNLPSTMEPLYALPQNLTRKELLLISILRRFGFTADPAKMFGLTRVQQNASSSPLDKLNSIVRQNPYRMPTSSLADLILQNSYNSANALPGVKLSGSNARVTNRTKSTPSLTNLGLPVAVKSHINAPRSTEPIDPFGLFPIDPQNTFGTQSALPGNQMSSGLFSDLFPPSFDLMGLMGFMPPTPTIGQNPAQNAPMDFFQFKMLQSGYHEKPCGHRLTTTTQSYIIAPAQSCLCQPCNDCELRTVMTKSPMDVDCGSNKGSGYCCCCETA